MSHLDNKASLLRGVHRITSARILLAREQETHSPLAPFSTSPISAWVRALHVIAPQWGNAFPARDDRGEDGQAGTLRDALVGRGRRLLPSGRAPCDVPLSGVGGR